MFWIVAAAASAQVNAQQPARSPAAPLVQARATVRILRAARLDFTSGTTSEMPATTRTQIRIGEATYPARIIEFE
jgi:hypothetical protein